MTAPKSEYFGNLSYYLHMEIDYCCFHAMWKEKKLYFVLRKRENFKCACVWLIAAAWLFSPFWPRQYQCVNRVVGWSYAWNCQSFMVRVWVGTRACVHGIRLFRRNRERMSSRYSSFGASKNRIKLNLIFRISLDCDAVRHNNSQMPLNLIRFLVSRKSNYYLDPQI